MKANELTTLLLAVFITLKLTNTIDWSWWWVLSPLWIPMAGVIVFLLLIIVGGVFLNLLGEISMRNKQED